MQNFDGENGVNVKTMWNVQMIIHSRSLSGKSGVSGEELDEE